MPDAEGDLFDEPPASPRAGRRRAANTVEAAPERVRAGAGKRDAEPLRVGEPGGPSHRPGDVPASFTRRYLTEALRGGGAVLYFEGPGAKHPAFRDDGRKLSTNQSHPAVIRDLTSIAAHRGWKTIQVRGSDEFRREAWLEATARGLEVKGYRPKERDQQELDRRLKAESRAAVKPAGRTSPKAPDRGDTSAEATATRRPETRDRPDYEAGVAGVLLESGSAPYRRRTGEPVTPYVRLDRGEGRALDIWGVGLPDALARSGARVGDAVRVRRDGIDALQREIDVRDPKTGLAKPEVRSVSRNRWVIEAERFRDATPGAAARDPDLRGAQSHLAVLNTVIDGTIQDPKLRANLRAEARNIVADELALGRRFTPARVREVEPVLTHDVGRAHVREVAAERAHRR